MSLGDASGLEYESTNGAVMVPLYLSAPTTVPVVVSYYTSSSVPAGLQPATARVDYGVWGTPAQPRTVTIPPGSVQATVNVPVRPDAESERDESFSVFAVAATGATVGDAVGVGTITDSDRLGGTDPVFGVSSTTVVEGQSGVRRAQVRVEFSRPVAADTTVDLATMDGSAHQPDDYRARLQSLTLPAGRQAATFDVAVNPNSAVGDDRAFAVRGVVSGRVAYAARDAVVAIAEDDVPATSSLAVTVLTATTSTVQTAVPAAVVTGGSVLSGDTAGLNVQIGPGDSTSGIDGSAAVRVAVTATTASAGTRSLDIRATGCLLGTGGATCPANQSWSRDYTLTVVVEEPQPGVVRPGFPDPAPDQWVDDGEGHTVLSSTVALYTDGLDAAAVVGMAAEVGGTVVGSSPDLGVWWIRTADPAAAIDVLAGRPGVTVVDRPEDGGDPSTDVPLDMARPDANLSSYTQSHVVAAWPRVDVAGRGPEMGIVDTGLYPKHDDLTSNLATYEAPAGSAAAWSVGNHGTHVAGTVCAADGGTRAVGIVPNCRLHALDLGGGPYTVEHFAERMNSWLSSHPGIRVVNMSWTFGAHQSNGCSDLPRAGSYAMFQTLFRRYPNVLFVAAAGNCGKAANGLPSLQSIITASPAHVSPAEPNVLSVSATWDTARDRFGGGGRLLTSFSNTDGEVAAPGDEILSTEHMPCAAEGLSCIKLGGVGRQGGTSMAAPHVAGIAGLMLTANPTATANDLERCLKETATTPVGGIEGAVLTPAEVAALPKEVNAWAAVECVRGGYEALDDGGDLDHAVGMSSDGAEVLFGNFLYYSETSDEPSGGRFIWNRRTGTSVPPPRASDFPSGLSSYGIVPRAISGDGGSALLQGSDVEWWWFDIAAGTVVRPDPALVQGLSPGAVGWWMHCGQGAFYDGCPRALSDDGNAVALTLLWRTADSWVPYFRHVVWYPRFGALTPVGPVLRGNSTGGAQISGAGDVVLWGDENGNANVVSVGTGQNHVEPITCPDASPGLLGYRNPPYRASLSRDGRLVTGVFTKECLVGGYQTTGNDTNGVWDWAAGTVTALPPTLMDADGAFSAASWNTPKTAVRQSVGSLTFLEIDLDPSPTTGLSPTTQVFVWDRERGTLRRQSSGVDGSHQDAATSHFVDVDTAGRTVLMTSTATNLVAEPAGPTSYSFVWRAGR